MPLPPIPPPLLAWYDQNRRSLPWRDDPTPYHVWLSEIMLQQTRVAAVMPYYQRWMEELPTVEALAAVDEERLMKLWQGLGYYSRARNLHAAAKKISQEFDGIFPATQEAVRSLPGVGDYTAAAVCSAAYDTPCAVLDGNVYRVLSRLFDVETPIDTTAGRKAFQELAQSQLDTARPGCYNQAIMDFGARWPAVVWLWRPAPWPSVPSSRAKPK